MLKYNNNIVIMLCIKFKYRYNSKPTIRNIPNKKYREMIFFKSRPNNMHRRFI